MPTYEYVCDACENAFDEFQSMSEPVLTKCPKCGKKKLRRLFGIGAAVLFKGSGFYETDYRSETYKTAAKADKDAGKPADTSAKPGASDTPATPAPEKPKKTEPKTPKSKD
jgi:putative FmdB family regulatory protein